VCALRDLVVLCPAVRDLVVLCPAVRDLVVLCPAVRDLVVLGAAAATPGSTAKLGTGHWVAAQVADVALCA